MKKSNKSELASIIGKIFILSIIMIGLVGLIYYCLQGVKSKEWYESTVNSYNSIMQTLIIISIGSFILFFVSMVISVKIDNSNNKIRVNKKGICLKNYYFKKELSKELKEKYDKEMNALLQNDQISDETFAFRAKQIDKRYFIYDKKETPVTCFIPYSKIINWKINKYGNITIKVLDYEDFIMISDDIDGNNSNRYAYYLYTYAKDKQTDNSSKMTEEYDSKTSSKAYKIGNILSWIIMFILIIALIYIMCFNK